MVSLASPLPGLPVRQIAYFVKDVRAAAAAHSATFGSGPYFVADNIALRLSLYRGQPAPLDHSSAYGQWGPVMVEFVQQNNDGPSVFRDMFGTSREGLHHVALFVDSLAEARARFEAQGMTTAFYAEMADGFAFAMVDAVDRYGHFIELYEPQPQLTGFYDMVRTEHEAWDGADPIRVIKFAD